MLATGGGDAVVNLWFDSTADDEREASKKQVRQSSNYLFLKAYTKSSHFPSLWHRLMKEFDFIISL